MKHWTEKHWVALCIALSKHFDRVYSLLFRVYRLVLDSQIRPWLSLRTTCHEELSGQMSPVWLLSCFFLGSFLKVNHLGGQIWNACLYFYTENTGIYCFSCCVKLDIIHRNKKWPLILPTYPTGYSDWESCLLKLLLRPKAVKDAKLHNSSKRNAIKNISIGFISYHVNHLNIPSCSSIHSDWLLGHLQLIAICIELSCFQLSFTALQLSLKCFIAPIDYV